MRKRLWQFVHNCVCHPIEGVLYLFMARVPDWCNRFHDWTADRAWGDE